MQIKKTLALVVLAVSVAGGPLLAQGTASNPSVPESGTPIITLPGLAKLLSEAVQVGTQSYNLSKAGDGFAKHGDWENAQSYYQQALERLPSNRDALYGLVEYSRITGDTKKEIEYYRRAVYSSNPASLGFDENNSVRLMTFVLLLCQSGQTAEAVPVYNHAASLLKYMGSKPSYGYMLPLFGTEPGQIAYTSARLQALAHVGLGIDSLYTQELKPAERLSHLREAVRLYPDSPAVYAYLCRQLENMGDAAGAKTAMARANGLGFQQMSALLDAQTARMQAERGEARK